MQQDDTILKVGHLIKFARKRKGITQDELVEISGVSKSTIAKTEQGSANPSFVSMYKIFKVLDIDIGALNNFQL